MKNINLSQSEDGVFRVIKKASGSALGNSELRGIFPEIEAAKLNKILSSMTRKGYLFPLKKGLYLVNEEPSKEPQIMEPFAIASRLYGGYLGFSSALRLYDLLDYEPFTIFVITKDKSASYKLGEYEFNYIAMGQKAVGETLHKGFYTSTRAKTFFDCFMKPQYAGGYSTLTHALYLDDKIEWDEFQKYLELFASHSLMQRTGYILGLLKTKTDKRIPAHLIDYLKKNINSKTRLIPDNKTPGKYVREWMLTDNEGEDKILSWWQSG
ncbi:MAG: hypothetical protein V1875_08865 [Candidatus Altiarchaeota archaeon]